MFDVKSIYAVQYYDFIDSIDIGNLFCPDTPLQRIVKKVMEKVLWKNNYCILSIVSSKLYLLHNSEILLMKLVLVY